MRLAAIDLGTNTALLLIAEVTGNRLIPSYETERFVRLGEGLEGRGRISPAALERLRQTLMAYRELLLAYNVATCIVAATSAGREAENQDALQAVVADTLGLPLEILSGEEEARWSMAGALAAPAMPQGPCLAVDIGGGSTELIAGRPEAITFLRSLPLGTVRLTERYFHRFPPTPAELVLAQEHICSVLAAQPLPHAPQSYTLVGIAGTCVSLAALETRRFPLLEPVALSREAIYHWRDRLLGMKPEDIRALWPALLAGRADVLPMGALLLGEIVAWGGWDLCYVSPFGLRHGLLLRWLSMGKTEQIASPAGPTFG